QRRQHAHANPEDHCALNIALYSKEARRWTMTERGARHCHRNQQQFTIGPSQWRMEGDTMVIDMDEVAVPWPHRVSGQVRLQADQWFNFSTPIDSHGKHRWGPLAPSARITVDLQNPSQRWQGQAYLDSNEGDEPIHHACHEWDWSRALLKDGSTAVIYDIQGKAGQQGDRLLALRFVPDGSVQTFEAPPRQAMPPTLWRIQRRMRSESPARVIEQLEDTPFYQRALLQSELLGETVHSFHETLYVPRLVSPVVQAMLPWRMPRRG
ncbi:MAG: carotenoid 1,2-hydratase, partial [Limnohabitans sp.]